MGVGVKLIVVGKEGAAGEVIGNVFKDELVVAVLQVGEHTIVCPLQAGLIRPYVPPEASPFKLSEGDEVIGEVLTVGHIVQAKEPSLASSSLNDYIDIAIALDRDLLLAYPEEITIGSRAEVKEAGDLIKDINH